MVEFKPSDRLRWADERGRVHSVLLERHSMPVAVPLPELAELTSADPDVIRALLERLGILKPTSEMIADAAEYVNRMRRLPPGTPVASEEIDKLLAADSKRGALSLARRGAERYTTLAAATRYDTEGQPYVDETQLFCRVDEADERECSSCASRAGIIGTLEAHSAVGMVGAASCQGGDY